jgi:CIC family chloride channel protein
MSQALKALNYLQRWVIFATLIGLISGIGAELFTLIFKAVTDLFLVNILNYTPPAAGGEGAVFFPNLGGIHRWLIPVVVGVGGLISGAIVYTFAPEAEGHGTDSMIESFHRKEGRIRGRVPLIKMIASAITIGTGGSAGREGPIAQIGAGFGSWLASRLGLSNHERRTMILCGGAAGIGAIFRAPLGASLFIIEVLYKRDMEIEVLVPAFLSSVVSYTVYASINGFSPIFGAISYEFTQPLELLFFLILGLVSAIASIVYVNVFYGLRNHVFRRIPLPNLVKPAIGGIMLGLVAIELPQTLEMGYGWVQLALYGQLTITAMLIIALAKMVTTSFTISSGGSGGVFAPSLVIGGLLGGVVGYASQSFAPGLITQPAAFVLVGMAAFFAGAAKVPISAMIMVAEMTRNYNFLIPAMVACGISYVASGKWTLYENQVESRIDSPAHMGEFSIDLLEEIKVKEIMTTRLVTVTPSTSLLQVSKLMASQFHLSYPVLEGGKLVGFISYRKLLGISPDVAASRTVGELMEPVGHTVSPEDTAADALRIFHSNNDEHLAVVDPENRDTILGLVTHSDVIHGQEAAKMGISHRRARSILDAVRVEEVMRRDLVLVDVDDAVERLLDVVDTYRYRGYPVIEEGRLVGIVTMEMILKAYHEGEVGVKAGDIMFTVFEKSFPDETVSEALVKMERIKMGRLPVVLHGRPDRVIGIITKTDILRALELKKPLYDIG